MGRVLKVPLSPGQASRSDLYLVSYDISVIFSTPLKPNLFLVLSGTGFPD